MDRSFHFNDTTFCVLSRWFAVFGNDVYTFNQYTGSVRKYFQYRTWLQYIFIITGNNNY